MISFDKITLRRGKDVLFSDATFTVHAKDKIGLVGANGCGKSSLFSMIRGELEEDLGTLSVPQTLTIASVRQETPDADDAALDYVLQGDVQWCQLMADLADAEHNDDGMVVSEIHQQLTVIDGYSAKARAGALMQGLGFTAEQENLPVSQFSGGWRMRLNLAQALMCRSDVLLLDEPTNHLDFETVVWLEQWIKDYQGAVLLISHDRDFLDKIINRVVHIEQSQVHLYTGNYSRFERMRMEKSAQQQSQYERQQKQIEHMQSFVTRFKAKATKAKQAQSRVKALERMQLIAPAHVDSPFSFKFAPLDFLHSPLMQLTEADIGYGENAILSGVDFALRPGDRIALLGQNGAGKSTLIKALARELKPLKGKMVEAKVLDIGYFAQHQLEQLHPEMSALQHLQAIDRQASEADLRKFLGSFDFQNDKALEPIAPFSGGEKARLVLALLVYEKPNVLLLDEPTNHLDLAMRHALTMALQSFEGAVLLVSHDRHMIRTVCDTLYLVANEKVNLFDGDLDDYAQWALEQSQANKQKIKQEIKQQATQDKHCQDTNKPQNTSEAVTAASRKAQRQHDAERRKKLQPLCNKAKKMEAKLDELQQEQTMLDQKLADSTLYEEANKQELLKVNQRYAEVKQLIEQTEEQWMIIEEEIEQSL